MISNIKFKIRYNTPEGKTKWFNCVQIEKSIKPKNSNKMYLHEDTISQLLALNNLKIESLYYNMSDICIKKNQS